MRAYPLTRANLCLDNGDYSAGLLFYMQQGKARFGVARQGNPYHKPAGPGGGQFVSKRTAIQAEWQSQDELLDRVKKGELTFDQATAMSASRGGNGKPKNITDTSFDNAIDKLGLSNDTRLRDSHNAVARSEAKWVSGANLSAKAEIVEAYKAMPEVKNVRLFMLYSREGGKDKAGFEKWIETPHTFWRGGKPEYGNTFSGFSVSKSVAGQFAKKSGGLYKVSIKPKALIGYSAAGNGEVFVPSGFVVRGGL